MKEPETVSDDRHRGFSGLKVPLMFMALPFVVYLPYWWLLHDVLPGPAASPEIGVEHMRVHYAGFWVLTYFPFAVICFIAAAVMLLRRVRFSIAARWLLIPAGLVSVCLLVLLILMVAGY